MAGRRSLVGSRYDLIDRNNNIVLEYRKKELIRLSLLDPVKGKSGEIKPLVSSLQTKYALKGYNIEAAALEAAGGKVSTSGKDITVTLPGYRFTNTPETDNTWSIDVTAEDVKGNLSRHEQSMVVIQAPTLSQKDSLLSVNPLTVAADKKSTTTLTVTAHDSDGTPVPGLALQTRRVHRYCHWRKRGNSDSHSHAERGSSGKLKRIAESHPLDKRNVRSCHCKQPYLLHG